MQRAIGPLLTGGASVYIAIQIARIADTIDGMHTDLNAFLRTTEARLQRAETHLNQRRKRWTPWF